MSKEERVLGFSLLVLALVCWSISAQVLSL